MLVLTRVLDAEGNASEIRLPVGRYEGVLAFDAADERQPLYLSSLGTWMAKAVRYYGLFWNSEPDGRGWIDVLPLPYADSLTTGATAAPLPVHTLTADGLFPALPQTFTPEEA